MRESIEKPEKRKKKIDLKEIGIEGAFLEKIDLEEAFDEIEDIWETMRKRKGHLLEPDKEMQKTAEQLFNFLRIHQGRSVTRLDLHEHVWHEMIISKDGRAIGAFVTVDADDNNKENREYSFHRPGYVIDTLKEAEKSALLRAEDLEKKAQSYKDTREKIQKRQKQ